MKALQSSYLEIFAKKVFADLAADEQLTLNFSAEETLFSRLSKAKVRQVTNLQQAFIDFNFIKGKPAETRKRRITGTKIINGDFHPQSPQPVKGIHRRIILIKERGLRHFQFKTLSGKSRFVQNGQHDFGKGIAAKLHRRDID